MTPADGAVRRRSLAPGTTSAGGPAAGADRLPRACSSSTWPRSPTASSPRDGAAAVAGYVVLAGFATCYVRALRDSFGAHGAFWVWYAGMVVLFLAELPLAHEDAFVMVYIVVLIIAALGRRAAPVVVGLVVAVDFLPPLVPSWHAAPWTSTPGVTHRPGGARHVRLLRDHPVQPALSEARGRGGPAGDRERALPHRPGPARPPRPLAHHHHREGRPGPTAGRRGTLPGRPPRSARWRPSPGGRWPTCAPRWPATGRSPSPASWPRAASCCGPPGSTPACRAPPTRCAPTSTCCSAGWCGRRSPTSCATRGPRTCTVTLGPDRVEVADDGLGRAKGEGSGLAGLRERVEAADGTLERRAGPVAAVACGWRVPAPRRRGRPARRGADGPVGLPAPRP